MPAVRQWRHSSATRTIIPQNTAQDVNRNAGARDAFLVKFEALDPVSTTQDLIADRRTWLFHPM
jgi:hypothetical protein